MSRFFHRFAPSTRSRRTAIRRGRAARPALESCEPRAMLSGWSPTPLGYTPAQIRQAYGFSQNNSNLISFDHGSISGDGSHQTIAIVVAYDDPNFVDSTSPTFGTSDLARFDRAFGLPDPPSFTKYNEYGQTSQLPGPDPAGAANSNGNWEQEEAIDIEWAHAIAPGASIDVVEANSPLGDLYTAVSIARQLRGVSVVSMSWGSTVNGGTTVYEGTSLDSYFNNLEVAFVASVGDAGSFTYPGSSDDVLGTAGTTLTLGPSGGYSGETIWNDASGSSGGGPDLNNPGKTGPDVAAVAEDLAAYDSYNGGSATPWHAVAGTSLAAPQWAGLLAIADQGRVLEGLGTLGSAEARSLIQAMPGFDFHQNIPGANSLGYSGTAVYGQGTPIANLVVNGLLQEPLTIPTGNTVAPGQTLSGTIARFQDNTSLIQGPGGVWIDWGDGTSSYGWIIGNNGQYQLQGTHTYATTGTYQLTAAVYGGGLPYIGTEDLVHGVVAVTTMTADQSWVNAVYKVVLGRAADPAGLNSWVGALEGLESRGVDPSTARSRVASAIATTTEGLDDWVDEVYWAFLGRAADPADQSSWVPLLQRGLPMVNFLADVLSSTEFQKDHNGVVSSGGGSNFLVALYQVVLKRTPGAAEVNDWLAPSANGGPSLLAQLGPYGVAYDFVTSAEFRADAANTNYGSVNQYQPQASKPVPFQYFLHVALPRYLWVGGPSSGAASSEMNAWVDSGADVWGMQFGFLASQEFYGDAAFVTL